MLETWVSEKLFDVVGFSDPTVGAFIVDLGKYSIKIFITSKDDKTPNLNFYHQQRMFYRSFLFLN